jgi:hypothetical protein
MGSGTEGTMSADDIAVELALEQDWVLLDIMVDQEMVDMLAGGPGMVDMLVGK